MTKKAGRVRQQFATLKAALLTGSVMATLAGTLLLGLQEPLNTPTAIAEVEPFAVVVPAQESALRQLPPDGRGVQIELKPIAQVVQPRISPVARTRSSR